MLLRISRVFKCLSQKKQKCVVLLSKERLDEELRKAKLQSIGKFKICISVGLSSAVAQMLTVILTFITEQFPCWSYQQ